MFSKILIANRGEIACRIIKTARRLGIKTVAVFSTIDENALHTSQADEAYELGLPPAAQSYLNGSRIIELALACEAQAIHPGYGFLSENAEFAQACSHAGLVFIGPPPEAITIMGNKNEAKSCMEAAGIPVIPGYLGEDQSTKAFTKAAKKIGYPILLKAAAGGGGKGMRLVEDPKNMAAAIESARREAQSSFSDDRLFIEKYLSNSRHVELQVFSDTHHNHVHLFDRDCSIQRRHQKIIEEAPAPYLTEKTKRAMQKTALEILTTIEYHGAGTIEFLVDEQENFYFMEMNTRLQVEHPITEMITGIDLVEWQCRVAAGEPLPLQQGDIVINGHAIEARLCAESPSDNFAPSTGRLAYLDFPNIDDHVRVDTGVRKNDGISAYYDSMIAKVIVHADHREDALLQLKSALHETHIVGVSSNTELLVKILNEADFLSGKINTTFIDNHPGLLTARQAIRPELLILAGLYHINQLSSQGQQQACRSNDPYSPWFTRDYWRLNSPPKIDITLWEIDANLIRFSGNHQAQINNEKYDIEITWQDDFQLAVRINNQSFHANLFPSQHELHLFYQGQHYTLHTLNPETSHSSASSSESHLSSPMPGHIIDVLVKPAQAVKKGDKLITLEAMKMEHHILAPMDGTIKVLHCAPGDSVNEGAKLIEFNNT